MNKLVIALAALALFASCSKKKSTVFENDTDFHDWINQQTIKNIPNAHSGFSASVIDSALIYSLGFCKTIENISPNKIKEVEFSYWYYATSDKTKLSTVISIDFNGQNIDWSGRPVRLGDLNKWVEVHETFKITEKAQPNNQLMLYVVDESKEQILVDDLKITFK